MENQDWERFGEEIRRNVQDAIDSRDYSMLNRTITDTVNGAVDYFSHTVRNVGNSVNANMKMQQEEAARRKEEEAARRRESSKRAQWNQQAGQSTGYRYQGTTAKYSQKKAEPMLFASTVGNRVAGILLSIAGYAIALPFLLTALMGMFMGVFAGDPEAGTVMGVSLAFVVVFGGLGILGTKLLSRVRRFRMYIRILGGREYCDIKELQTQTGRAKKNVVRDLEQMIQKGWFKEGHMDSKKTCLMVSNQSYHQYTCLLYTSGFGKHYLALLTGIPSPDEADLTNYLIKDNKTNTSRICTQNTPGSKVARLHYKLIQKWSHSSLAEITLDTGRHHQIRVQMAHLGCPIQGDVKYGATVPGQLQLYAYRLTFRHPVHHQLLEFTLDTSHIYDSKKVPRIF